MGAVLFTFGASLAAHLRHLYELLARTPLSEGLPWLAVGLSIVLLAFAISLLKMGLWHRSWQWLQRANLALGGTSSS